MYTIGLTESSGNSVKKAFHRLPVLSELVLFERLENKPETEKKVIAAISSLPRYGDQSGVYRVDPWFVCTLLHNITDKRCVQAKRSGSLSVDFAYIYLVLTAVGGKSMLRLVRLVTTKVYNPH